MDLYNPETGVMIQSDLEHDAGNRLIAVFNDLAAAGVPLAQIVAYFSEIATSMRCEVALTRKFRSH